MTSDELRNLRHRIKFDMRSMASSLGLRSCSTYQRYEDGTARVPAHIARAALALEEFERECDAAREAETEDLLRRQYPGGIPTARKRQG